ncbi:PH domain-containing protein [Deinococcus radiophilus]|uniref:Bacterial Pleckstrin homology domain-containing protein n=1 Tax=Deinococcus radiophilus TaxID=32062 RepID=A0A431W447_9DEIO|nr:PH domain-containing protein [Deinococcus radiophilus]RTR30239.1 hypothetical protein EJ104_01645 [Deinococcus radiophilus]UFA49969.1 PH domain-containing protein [Deinococcus radiophilus]
MRRDLTALTPAQQTTPRWWPWLLALTLLSLLPLPVLMFGPLLKGVSYEVANGQIVARSVGSSVQIEAGTPVQSGPVTLTGRKVGSEMAGYVVGRFSSDQGTLNVYSDGSHGSDALLFATQPQPTLLTPADPQALLSAWRSGGTATFHPARRAGLDPLSLLILLPVLPIVWFLLRPPAIRYRLDGDALVVHTGLGHTRFPLDDTQASVTREALGMRLFGSSIPGYHTGTFASNAHPSGRVQAAATDHRPAQALLLTHEGKTYYLTPQQPDVVAGWFRGAPPN